MFTERWVSYSNVNKKMMPFRGQASWVKMTSPIEVNDIEERVLMI
jgi:hypothetical protein